MIRSFASFPFIAAICLLAACGNNPSSDKPASDSTATAPAAAGVTVPDGNLFKDSLDGKKTALYILRNKNNASATITNYGARVSILIVPGKNWVMTDVSVGYDSIGKYIHQPETYFCAIVCR